MDRTKFPRLTGVLALHSLPEKILARRVIQERILFEFDLHANFPEPSPYRLHAVLYDRRKQPFIESKPITILMIEPQDIDRLVINILKTYIMRKLRNFG